LEINTFYELIMMLYMFVKLFRVIDIRTGRRVGLLEGHKVSCWIIFAYDYSI